MSTPAANNGRQMPLHRGTHKTLEDAADAIIKQSLQGVTRAADKLDILTPWKERARHKREVMVPSGTPDSSNRKGIFGRALNSTSPHLNSRDSIVRGHRGYRPSDDPWNGSAIDGSVNPSWDSE